jgi:Domain of unknown function (DU1801)
MAELKTSVNNASVTKFLKNIKDPDRRRDCLMVMDLMKKVTGAKPKMWGSSIVGFGSYHYVYESGREGDWFLTGFSPRKQNLTLYIMSGFRKYESLLKKLGKHRTGKSCLYINGLDEIDLPTLPSLITESVKETRRRNR